VNYLRNVRVEFSVSINMEKRLFNIKCMQRVLEWVIGFNVVTHTFFEHVLQWEHALLCGQFSVILTLFGYDSCLELIFIRLGGNYRIWSGRLW